MNLAFIALTLVTILARGLSHPDLDVMIRSATYSWIVIEDTNDVLTVQTVHGRDSQIWHLISTGTGTFYIQHKITKKVIQQEEGGLAAITVAKIDGELKQQWYIGFNATIINADSGHMLDSEFGNFNPGQRIIVHQYKHPRKGVFIAVKP